MTGESAETEFERRTRALLQAGVEELSGHVRSRLTQARHAALDQGRAARRVPSWQRWLPAGAAASVVLLALWFTLRHRLRPRRAPTVQPGSGPASDFDFYEWAAGESTGTNGGTAGT